MLEGGCPRVFMLKVWRGENLGVGDSEGERERRGERGGGTP